MHVNKWKILHAAVMIAARITYVYIVNRGRLTYLLCAHVVDADKRRIIMSVAYPRESIYCGLHASAARTWAVRATVPQAGRLRRTTSRVQPPPRVRARNPVTGCDVRE